MATGAPDPSDRAAAVRRGQQAARERGVHVGRPAATLPDATRRRLTELREAGCSWRAMAAALNAEGVPTPSGTGQWHFNSVRRAVADLEP